MVTPGLKLSWAMIFIEGFPCIWAPNRPAPPWMMASATMAADDAATASGRLMCLG
jgi:hypothetical protein